MGIYKKLFKYVPKMKYLGYVAILFSMVSAFLMAIGYYYIFKFLESLIALNDFSFSGNMAIKSAIYLTVTGVFYIFSLLLTHVLGFRLETMLRKKGIDGLTASSFRYFDLNSSGSIRKNIDDNAVQTHMIVAHMIPDMSQAILVPIFILALAFIVSLRVGIAIIILTLISGITLKFMMGEAEFMKIYQKSLEKLSAEAVEYVRGMQVVKIFGAKVEHFKALYSAIKDYAKYAYEYSLSCKRPYVFYQVIFFGFIPIVTIPLSFYLTGIDNQKYFAVELIMALFLSGLLFVAFMKIMYLSMYIFQGNYAVDKLEKLYEEMQEDKLSFGNEEKFSGYDIEFVDVTFGYNDKKVLDGLSFKLEAGKTYALVGDSGSGKSTIAKLISGFYKVDDGAIKIGGKALSEYTEDSLIKAISFVFQNSKLFKKSIYDNVAIANKNATREDVLKAMELAGCNSILDKFPGRENTIIGSKGVYLSGGETQRIAIARAILKDAKIIIMDEASAAIDPDNEHELQKAFKNLITGKTVIMIAHRLSSIRSVDEILVVENGRIIERGKDELLMKNNSRYKELIDLYNSANEWRLV